MSTELEIEILNRDECIAIFKQSVEDDEELCTYRVEHFVDEFFGFLGEYYRLVCNGSKGTFKEYFIKSLPIMDAKNKERVENIGVFSKESSLYKTLINDFDTAGKLLRAPMDPTQKVVICINYNMFLTTK